MALANGIDTRVYLESALGFLGNTYYTAVTAVTDVEWLRTVHATLLDYKGYFVDVVEGYPAAEAACDEAIALAAYAHANPTEEHSALEEALAELREVLEEITE